MPLTIHKHTFFKPEHFYCKWKLLKDVSLRITLTWPNKKSKVMCVLLPLHLRIFRCVRWWKVWDKHVSLSILGLLGRTLRNFIYPPQFWPKHKKSAVTKTDVNTYPFPPASKIEGSDRLSNLQSLKCEE